MAKALTPGEGDGVEAFFRRCGLSPDTRYRCHALVWNLFPGASIEEAKPQGFCSYTLCVGYDRIIQFRPPVHRLDIALAEAARDVYGALAPETQLLTVMQPLKSDLLRANESHSSGDKRPVDEAVVLEDERSSACSLDVISMARISGVSLAELRASSSSSSPSSSSTSTKKSLTPAQLHQQRGSIISHFARVIATGWTHGRRRPVPDDPIADCPRLHLLPTGRVGRSLRWRLEQMDARLPRRFRPVVGGILDRLDEIVGGLPWVLTHGDIVPANMMTVVQAAAVANETTTTTSTAGTSIVLSGLLDWAEAEYLPFGVGLYGLEELLGETDASGWFSYYPDERELRGLFWRRLEAELPCMDLRAGSHLRGLVAAAHTLGVLLWHGFAFDDGKLDRVVEEGRDAEEIRRLELFLQVESRHHESIDNGNRKKTLAETVGLAWQCDLGGALVGVWKQIQQFAFGHTLFGKL